MDTYKIIENNFDIAYHIYKTPLSVSNLDLADQIEEKWGIKISHATIGRFRKKLPSVRIEMLQKDRKEVISILKFVIDVLKEELEKIKEGNPEIKLKLSQEMLNIVKQHDSIISEEIKHVEFVDILK